MWEFLTSWTFFAIMVALLVFVCVAGPLAIILIIMRVASRAKQRERRDRFDLDRTSASWDDRPTKHGRGNRAGDPGIEPAELHVRPVARPPIEPDHPERDQRQRG